MTPYDSTVAEGTAQIFPAGTTGQLREVYVLSVAVATRYLWFFNGTSSAGVKMCTPVRVPAGEDRSISFGDLTRQPMPQKGKFTDGVFVGSSTSPTTYTASGGADFVITAEAV